MFEEDKIIITGHRNVGKSTLLRTLALEYDLLGILSVKKYLGNTFIGYVAMDIKNLQERLLLSTLEKSDHRIGPFYIQSQGLAFVDKVMAEALKSNKRIVLDEVGLAELKEDLFYDYFQKILHRKGPFALVIQEQYLQDFYNKYPILKTACLYRLLERKWDFDAK